MKIINFFLESLKNFKTVGNFIPSSRVSAEKMTKPIDFARARLIIELGGGTGPITREILAKMRQDARLIVFEINPVFINILRQIGDARLVIINGSATDMVMRLKEQGIDKVDYVVSTLPLAQINTHVKIKVLEAVHNVLQDNGRYIQIQYSLLSMSEIKKRFSTVKLDFTPLNFPPAFFYICER